MSTVHTIFSWRLLSPRYWLTWVLLGVGWLAAQLPYPAQMALGRGFGRLMGVLGRRRREIAIVNLRLCFPDHTPQQRDTILQGHFASLGMSMMEMALCWFASPQRLRRLSHVEGVEHLHAALRAGKGAILLSGHFTTLEIGATLLSLEVPMTAMYRDHKNALFDAVMKRGRDRFAAHGTVIARGDIRAMVRSLRHNLPVWYAPDQNYGREHSIFVPFFGVPAATITATSRLARMSGAPVVPFYQQRLADGSGYRLVVCPALEDFPGASAEQDTRRINALIESWIVQMPEQYLWVHRRFKTRPEGTPDVYARA